MAWRVVDTTTRGCFDLAPVFLFFSVKPSTCSSSGSNKWAQYFNNTVTTLQPGSPCNDFKGYCDVFMRCRLVDADGPLARLKKAIFNPELYENIAEWIVVSVFFPFLFFGQTGNVASLSVGKKHRAAVCTCCCCARLNFICMTWSPATQAHWWAVLLMGIALILLMAGFIKICSVHTPSSNPKLPPPKPLPGTVPSLNY